MPQDGPLSYTVSQGAREGILVIRLSGPLTLSNMFEFQAELRTIVAPLVVVDLTESPYMDSAGLGVLINFYVSAQKNGRRIALAGVNHRIEALLDMTHVKDLLRVFPTVEAAETAG